MIIEKINIKSFGMITDMSLDFSEDINVIVGRNEAGKSTVAAFIRYMLYGFTDDGKGGLEERKKRINWDTGMAHGSMYVRVDGTKVEKITEMSGVSGCVYCINFDDRNFETALEIMKNSGVLLHKKERNYYGDDCL